MRRYPDWPQRLGAAIAERRNKPHAWGDNDCALFAADLVAAMTGQDFGALFRGRYHNEAGARAILRSHGWSTLADVADHCLPRRLGRPRRGDLVLCDGKFGPFLGIVWAGGVIGAGPGRPTQWPVEGILAAWSVG